MAELRWLRQLEERNRKLKQLVADLSLDKGHACKTRMAQMDLSGARVRKADVE